MVRLRPAQPGPRTAMTPHPTAYHVSLSFTRIAYMCGPEPIQFSLLELGYGLTVDALMRPRTPQNRERICALALVRFPGDAHCCVFMMVCAYLCRRGKLETQLDERWKMEGGR